MKTLFIPLDLSNHAYNALDYAIQLAAQVNSKQLVIYHHNPPVYAGDIPVLYSDDLERIHLEIKEFLEKDLVKRLKKWGLEKIKTKVLVNQEDGAVHTIVKYSKKENADLIIMGSHGHTGLHHLIFGSVTAGVMEDSRIPILAIPQKFKFQNIQKLSFASTLKDLKQEMELLKPTLNTLKSSLDIVHLQFAWDPKPVVEEAKAHIESLGKKEISLTVLKSDVEQKLSDQIQSYMKKSKPDWLVMFPRRLGWFTKIFISSTSLAVLHHSRKPMLFIQKEV